MQPLCQSECSGGKGEVFVQIARASCEILRCAVEEEVGGGGGGGGGVYGGEGFMCCTLTVQRIRMRMSWMKHWNLWYVSCVWGRRCVHVFVGEMLVCEGVDL